MSQNYTISLVQQTDAEAVMTLLRRTFYIDEPLNAAVGLCDNNAPTPELDEYCTHSLLEGLSFKAVDDQGNIVGVMISGVVPLKEEANGNDLHSQAQRCKNPKFQRILHILARREENARLWEKFPKDQNAVEVMVAATDPSWRRKGIMINLLRETEKATLAKGIRLLRMDCSSHYSALSAEHLGFTCYYSCKKATLAKGIRLLRMDCSSHYSALSAEHLGFTCYYSCKYTDIKLDGAPIILPAEPHVDDRVYVKQLTQ
ncbi:hypothetical protein NE865_04723 [Phthorimaea operculella]|nr:hypothetical protein NE865_04723 [Phthorimaea operculella]